MAIQLDDGKIITGRGSDIMTPAASCVINSIKYLANISEDIHLISPVILEPLMRLKKDAMGIKNPVLNLEEVLNAISICAATNTMVELALSKLKELRNCEAHSSHMMSTANENVLRKLGIRITSEARFPSNDLFYM